MNKQDIIDIAAVERVLTATATPIRQLCTMAKITPQSWRNWRDGRMLPQMAKWQRVLAAVEDLKASQRVSDARHPRKRSAAWTGRHG